MQNYKKTSIIIVNYKSKERLKKCIDSVFDKFENKNFEIVVINNDQEENVSKALDEFPQIRVINLEKNVGFGKAVNAGAKIAQGEWLMLLNPDTQLLTSQREMFSFFAATPEAGIISPKLTEESGETQKWSVGAEPGLLDLLGNNIGLPRSKKIWESQKTRTVDWVSGAAMIIEKDLFDKVGGFDENFFMYFEDIDLCKRARETGKKVFCFPQERVLHLGGKSIENAEKQKADYYKSQDYYFQKHFGERHARYIRFLRNIFTKQ